MEGEISPKRSIDLKQSPSCEECGSNPWKYKCPACSIRTCSLPCVQSHKRRTSCTGQKSYSEVVPLSRFDDQLLISDYRFLEEANRIADSARRCRGQICGSHFLPWLPVHLKILKSVAYRRRTTLLFLPSGMSRRKKNQSRFDSSRKALFWTIDWRFHSAKIVVTDHGVDENRNLKEVFEKNLKPGPWKHKLKAFCDEDIGKLKFYLAKNPKGCRPVLRELDITRPIRQQLTGVLIVEYPVIHVYLSSHTCEFEVEKRERKPFPDRLRTREIPAADTVLSPKGITFREEEIDDAGCDETRVMDLKHSLINDHPEGLRKLEVTFTERANSHSNTEVQGVSFMGSDSGRCQPSVVNKSHGEHDVLDKTTGSDFEFEQNLEASNTEIQGVSIMGSNSGSCHQSCTDESHVDPNDMDEIADCGFEFDKDLKASNSETRGILLMGPDSGSYQPSLEIESLEDPNDHMDEIAGSDFEFEQDLKDAYTSLLGEINTDDFLCLDGTLHDEDYTEGTICDLGNFGGKFLEEELEEGEIRS